MGLGPGWWKQAISSLSFRDSLVLSYSEKVTSIIFWWVPQIFMASYEVRFCKCAGDGN